MQISIELQGKKKVSGILSRLAGHVRDLRPAFKQIGMNFREMEKKTFEKQGSPQQWRVLSPTYAAWKAKNHPGKPIMVLQGDLKKSLVSAGGDHIERIKRMEAEYGTKDPKGDWHQRGAGKLPVRKVISPTASDKTEWINIIRSFIVEKLKLTRSKF
jgi:phage gpG-like protein